MVLVLLFFDQGLSHMNIHQYVSIFVESVEDNERKMRAFCWLTAVKGAGPATSIELSYTSSGVTDCSFDKVGVLLNQVIWAGKALYDPNSRISNRSSCSKNCSIFCNSVSVRGFGCNHRL
jgi:hypothetical protein